MGLRLERSASNSTTRAPVASITARWARTRVTTATDRPIATAARAMGRKCEAKNQSSVTTKTSRFIGAEEGERDVAMREAVARRRSGARRMAGVLWQVGDRMSEDVPVRHPPGETSRRRSGSERRPCPPVDGS